MAVWFRMPMKSTSCIKRWSAPGRSKWTTKPRDDFTRRMQEYMSKAVHEGKVNLSWINQNQDYVDALNHFIERILMPGTRKRSNPFLQQLEKFLRPVQFFGALNSLAQVLLKVRARVPDIYRGTEFWDFSLVDPDNRRPVDYGRATGGIDRTAAPRAARRYTRELLQDMLKDFSRRSRKIVDHHARLRFRREPMRSSRRGSYIPLFASGNIYETCGRIRAQWDGRRSITAVPRFSYTLMKGEMRSPIGPEAWQDSNDHCSGRCAGIATNVMTGESVRSENGQLLCREVFGSFPVALLASREERDPPLRQWHANFSASSA